MQQSQHRNWRNWQHHNYVDFGKITLWLLLQPTTWIEYEYSQTLDFALEYKHEYCSFLSSPLAVKRDIAVTFLLSCMCMHCAWVCASVRICAIWNIFLGRLKVKVTLEGHINELCWAITPTYMHGFQNSFAQVFSLKSRSAIWNICSCTYTYPPSPPKKKKKKRFFVRLGFLVSL